MILKFYYYCFECLKIRMKENFSLKTCKLSNLEILYSMAVSCEKPSAFCCL